MILTKQRKILRRNQVETTEEGTFVKMAFYPGPGEFLGVRALDDGYELLVYKKREAKA